MKLNPINMRTIYAYEVEVDGNPCLVDIIFQDGKFIRANCPFTGKYTRDMWRALALIERQVEKIERAGAMGYGGREPGKQWGENLVQSFDKMVDKAELSHAKNMLREVAKGETIVFSVSWFPAGSIITMKAQHDFDDSEHIFIKLDRSLFSQIKEFARYAEEKKEQT
jgi:hypothetical protein